MAYEYQWNTQRVNITTLKVQQAETWDFTFSTTPNAIGTLDTATAAKGAGVTSVTTTGYDAYGETADFESVMGREEGYSDGTSSGTTITLSGTVDSQASGITGNVDNFSVITLSGTVDSQSSGITGAVERVITLSGTVAAQAADVTGNVDNFVVQTLSGTVQAQSAGITGAVERAITLSGTVQSQAAGITGAVERVVTLSGTVQAQSADVTGNVTNVTTQTLSGTVQAQSAGITGAVERVITLSGTVASQAADVTGNVNNFVVHTLSGTVQSQSSGITGAVERASTINKHYWNAVDGGDFDPQTVTYTAGQADFFGGTTGGNFEDTSNSAVQEALAALMPVPGSVPLRYQVYLETDQTSNNRTARWIIEEDISGDRLVFWVHTRHGGTDIQQDDFGSSTIEVTNIGNDWLLIDVSIPNAGAQTNYFISFAPTAGETTYTPDVTVQGLTKLAPSVPGAELGRLGPASDALDAQSADITGSINRVISLSGTVGAQAAGITGNVSNFSTITLSGTIAAQSAGITGTVKRELDLNGTVAAQDADITGAVVIEGTVALSGTVQAQSAGITGDIERIIPLSGTVQAQSATVTGAVERAVTLSGTVAAQSAGITGAVERAVTLSGTVQAQSATVTGVIERAITISGVLPAQNAGVTGNVAVSGAVSLSGTIQAQNAGITGTIILPDAVYGGIYNASETFPIGATVTIALFDPITAASISLSSAVCEEMPTGGATNNLFIWDTSKLSTQPTEYQEYGWTMTDGTTEKGGMIRMGDPARLIRVEKLLRNRRETDPATGQQRIYDDDGVTPLFEGNIYDDIAGTTPYNASSTGIDRADRLDDV